MDSGMISKIQKAKQYAEERERIHFKQFSVEVDGGHRTHLVTYEGGKWGCDCSFFQQRGVCSHTMAIERVLDAMLHPVETADA